MRIRATVRIRNDALIAAREKRGWSQRDLAEKAGVSLQAVLNLEKLDYTRKVVEDDALKLAVVLELPSDEVLPLDAPGKKVQTDFKSVKEIPFSALPAAKVDELKQLSYEPVVSSSELCDLQGRIRQVLETLTYRQARVLTLRYGLEGEPKTLGQVAKELKVHRERVRQIELRALCRLQHPCRVAVLEGQTPYPEVPEYLLSCKFLGLYLFWCEEAYRVLVKHALVVVATPDGSVHLVSKDESHDLGIRVKKQFLRDTAARVLWTMVRKIRNGHVEQDLRDLLVEAQCADAAYEPLPPYVTVKGASWYAWRRTMPKAVRMAVVKRLEALKVTSV